MKKSFFLLLLVGASLSCEKFETPRGLELTCSHEWDDKSIIEGNTVTQEHSCYLYQYGMFVDEAKYSEKQELVINLSTPYINAETAELFNGKELSTPWHGRFRMEEFAVYVHWELIDCEPLKFPKAGTTYCHPQFMREKKAIEYPLEIEEHHLNAIAEVRGDTFVIEINIAKNKSRSIIVEVPIKK